MLSAKFKELKSVIMDVVPASGGHQRDYLDKQFEESNLQNMLRKLQAGEALTGKHEFEGKIAEEPYAQFPERLLLLYYVLEPETDGKPLRDQIATLVESFTIAPDYGYGTSIAIACLPIEQQKMLKALDVAKKILSTLPNFPSKIEALLASDKMTLTMLTALREFFYGLNILESTVDRYKRWKSLLRFLPKETAETFSNAQETIGLFAPCQLVVEEKINQLLVSPPVNHSAEASPVVIEAGNSSSTPQKKGWMASARYYLFSAMDAVEAVADCIIHAESFLTGQEESVLTDVLPDCTNNENLLPVTTLVETESTHVLQDDVAETVEMQFNQNELSLTEVLAELHRLEKTHAHSIPEQLLEKKINLRVRACQLITNSITLISKEASPQRTDTLQQWSEGIQALITEYKHPDASEDSLKALDERMRNLAHQKLIELQKSYRSSDKKWFSAILEEIVVFIKTRGIFNCSTLAKAKHVSECLQSSLFGAAPPAGRPSRVASFPSLVNLVRSAAK